MKLKNSKNINKVRIHLEACALSAVLDKLFFQNEEIFIQLDELDKLERITHA